MLFPLHFFQIIKLLIEYMTLNTKNFRGKTALEIFQANSSGDQDLAKRLRRLGRPPRHFAPTLSLSQFFSMELFFFEKYINDTSIKDASTREVILLVSTLIAAATYQAMLTPPEGNWLDSSSITTVNSTVVTTNSSSIPLETPHQAGDIIMSVFYLYLFSVVNSMTFWTSIGTIWATTLKAEADTCLRIPMGILCLAYYISFVVQIVKADRVAGLSLMGPFLFFGLTVWCLPMYIRRKHIRVERGIEAIRRHIATFWDRRILSNSQVLFTLSIHIACASNPCFLSLRPMRNRLFVLVACNGLVY